jgi:hypothetical protein
LDKMKIVETLSSRLRWISVHPRQTGMIVALILAPLVVLFGNRAPWLVFVPILAAVAFTLPGELGRPIKKAPPPAPIPVVTRWSYSDIIVVNQSPEHAVQIFGSQKHALEAAIAAAPGRVRFQFELPSTSAAAGDEPGGYLETSDLSSPHAGIATLA